MIRKTVVLVVIGLSLFTVGGAQAGKEGEGKGKCAKSEQCCKKIDKAACESKIEKGACSEKGKKCSSEKKAECEAKGAKKAVE